MKVAPKPLNEAERLSVLREMSVLDTEPEPVFDNLVEVAAAICGTPIALISLLDAERQWFKARVGLDATETPRDLAFCAHTILGSTTMIVRDAREDDRFHDNPLVTGAPHVRFYAGAPVLTRGGHALGTLCVIDQAPRELSAEQIRLLGALSAAASAHLELRRDARALEHANQKIRASRDAEAESRAQLQDLLDGVHDLVQSTYPDGRFRYVNRAWKETLGYSDAEIASLRLWEIVPPDSSPDARRAHAQAMAGTPTRGVRGGLIARDGRRVHVECNANWKIEDGKPQYSRAIFRDITARVEAENARNDFAFAVSKDLQAPLTAMRGALDLLSEEPLSPNGREVLSVATSHADRLFAQVQDVVDLRRIEAGTFPMAWSSIDARDLVEDAARAVATLLRQRAVTWRASIDADASGRTDGGALAVRADREVLVHALSHFAAHAARRTPPGGAVTCAITESSDQVRISIEDEGPPIPKEMLRWLFVEPGRRPHAQLAPMGAAATRLAVSRAIIEAHGGTVHAEMASGGGARIEMRLPLCNAPPA